MSELAESGAGFETPAPGSTDAPVLQLGAYEGPLDLLLELARAQRVDLTQLSMVVLAEAFVVRLEAAIATQRVSLATLGDWLVMAATLLALRTRLLLPPSTAEHRAADQEAAALREGTVMLTQSERFAEIRVVRPTPGAANPGP